MGRGIGVAEWIRATVPEWTTSLFELLSLPGDLLVIVPLLGLLYLFDVVRSLRESSTHATAEKLRPLCSDRTASIISAPIRCRRKVNWYVHNSCHGSLAVRAASVRLRANAFATVAGRDSYVFPRDASYRP